jgi:hypothetical protein
MSTYNKIISTKPHTTVLMGMCDYHGCKKESPMHSIIDSPY